MNEAGTNPRGGYLARRADTVVKKVIQEARSVGIIEGPSNTIAERTRGDMTQHAAGAGSQVANVILTDAPTMSGAGIREMIHLAHHLYRILFRISFSDNEAQAIDAC